MPQHQIKVAKPPPKVVKQDTEARALAHILYRLFLSGVQLLEEFMEIPSEKSRLRQKK